MGIIDLARNLAEQTDGGSQTRAQRRELERTMIKQKRSPEEIRFALKQVDEYESANRIYTKAINDLLEIGYGIAGKINWHQSGCNLQIGLIPMSFQQLTELKKITSPNA